MRRHHSAYIAVYNPLAINRRSSEGMRREQYRQKAIPSAMDGDKIDTAEAKCFE